MGEGKLCRRALMDLVRNDTDTRKHQQFGETRYLHLTVRLHVAAVGDDPLCQDSTTQTYTPDLSEFWQDGIVAKRVEIARHAVQQMEWSDGIDNSGNCLRILFEDDGKALEAIKGPEPLQGCFGSSSILPQTFPC
jgi:hypothetical protein